MFVRGANDDAGDASLGEKISVADFFAEKYHKLKYPNLPCIDGMSGTQKRANWLPMEAVKVYYFKIKNIIFYGCFPLFSLLHGNVH